MAFKYRMMNAPSAHTVDRAAQMGCNWVIVHSAGLGGETRHKPSNRPMDEFPIYFDAYPKVAEVRHYRDAVWLEPLRREITALCERAASQELNVAFHVYEPTFPHIFELEYPDIVGLYHRPTQSGTMYYHSHVDPDKAGTWELLRAKYAELARDFPALKMIIISTWDGAGSRWCIPKAKMPLHRRFVKMIEAARDGVLSVRKDIVVCLRLWGRNWPPDIYRESHALIARITGVENADDLMEPVARPHNDPDVVIPKILAELPPDVPIMYKSTRMDIHDAQPLTHALGKYPKDREQIMEISYEQYHKKPWPWCKVKHIRLGLEGAAKHGIAGFLALPVNMGNNDRECEPEKGNLGRMNTWLFEKLLAGDRRSDEKLVAAWLEKEFGAPQPQEAVDLLLEADDLVDKGIQWGGGVWARDPFASLHTTKLYWMYDGYIQDGFPKKMADPDLATIESMISMKHSAHERACAGVEKIKAARAAMAPRLYEELLAGYTMLADYILLCRDWHSYLLMQYAIERGLYPADRQHLTRMSRYVENFIRNLRDLRETDAARHAFKQIRFPDEFPIS